MAVEQTRSSQKTRPDKGFSFLPNEQTTGAIFYLTVDHVSDVLKVTIEQVILEQVCSYLDQVASAILLN